MSKWKDKQRSSRAKYEFEISQKRYAKERANYKCEVCGRKFDARHLECHHRIAIHFAKQYSFISPSVIKSLANLQIVCSRDHKDLHFNESEEEYKRILKEVLEAYASGIIGMIDKMVK